MHKPMSEDLKRGFTHEIRVRINNKTHYLYVEDDMGVVLPRTFDSEGVEKPQELRPLDVIFNEIMAARELMRSLGIRVSLEGV